MRLRDRAGVAVRGCVEDPRADGRRTGGDVPPSGGVPVADPDDGLVQIGRRSAPAHTARVRLERGRSSVLQSRRQLADGALHVPFHVVRRVRGAGPKARVQELQRHRQQYRVQRAAHRSVAQCTK